MLCSLAYCGMLPVSLLAIWFVTGSALCAVPLCHYVSFGFEEMYCESKSLLFTDAYMHICLQGLTHHRSIRPLWMTRSSGTLHYPRSLRVWTRSSCREPCNIGLTPQTLRGYPIHFLKPRWGSCILHQTRTGTGIPPLAAYGGHQDHAWTANLDAANFGATELVSSPSHTQHHPFPSMMHSGNDTHSFLVASSLSMNVIDNTSTCAEDRAAAPGQSSSLSLQS